MYPADLKYDKKHAWVRPDGETVVIGVSHFAQDQLGEVVYVDLPDVGDEVVAGETFGEIESVKSVSELFSPVSGEIVSVNDDLADAPEAVNEDCYGEGWMVQVKMSDPAELDTLLAGEDYEAFLADEA